jgi:3-dehydroquinate synthase
VDLLYGQRIREYFAVHNVDYRVSVLRVSEDTKTMDSVLVVARELENLALARRYEPIIAFGGGVLLQVMSGSRPPWSA